MKKLLSILLCGVLVVSLVACAGDSKETAPSAKTDDISPETTAVSDTEDGPLAPYEDTLVIEVPLTEAANTFYVEGESIESNFVTQFYEEKLNILYQGKWQVDSAQGEEKLNAAVASNDLPDMFTCGPELLGRLIKAEQVQPIGEYYDTYATDALREICDYQEGRGFYAGTKDGERYAMPVPNDFANNVAMLYLREDWLEKLNLEVPKTLEELVEVARAFRDGDPDGNGADDTIAIALDKAFGQDRAGINALTNPLGAYSAIWIPDGEGGLKYSSIQPEMKEGLAFIKSLYEEGLLDKEFAVKDGSKIAEDIAAGKIGIFPGVFWNTLHPLAGTIENFPDADWVPCPIGKNDDGKIVTQNKINSYFSVVVREGFEHPEALIKSMNLWEQMFHGEYADHFNDLLSTEKYMPIADNWHGYAKPVFFAHPEKNIHLSDNFIEMWEAQDIDLAKTGEARNRYEIVSAGGSQGWGHKTFLLESEQVLKEYDDFVYDEFVGAPTDTMVLRTANLSKKEYEVFIEIIMGGDIDLFDNFVDEWKAEGGDEITAEVSEWYRSVT